MVSYNRVILGGNLTRDPELRFTQGGIPVTNFGLAVNRVRSKRSECKLVHPRRFPSREAARSAVFEYLEAFYNRRGLHSALGYVNPESYEDLGAREAAVA